MCTTCKRIRRLCTTFIALHQNMIFLIFLRDLGKQANFRLHICRLHECHWNLEILKLFTSANKVLVQIIKLVKSLWQQSKVK
jgi:hypothetical protein